MIDLHCHILPGVDDGPANFDETLRMARFCVADGITHIVATPHCHRYVHLLRAEIVPRVMRLNADLIRAEIALTIAPGSEIQVTDTAEFRREFEANLLCHLGDGRAFTLLEFNWERTLYPAGMPQLIEWLRGKGMTPILAHPERHDFFDKEPALLDAMVEAGAWVQITVDSLIGNHGSTPEILGERFLKKYPEAVLSTDAHNMTRCSGMSVGFAWVRKNLGQARADDLMARGEAVWKRISDDLAKTGLSDR